MKQIQFTSGCPNNCSYCYEPKKLTFYDPQIPENEDLVQILDINFLSNPEKEKHLINLWYANNKSYELVCGVDFRLMNNKIAKLNNYFL